ncbi:uncharacterized protein K452DRAFT_293234 [Aplosporella prunicola CBS 121167]|uniref:Uncharacterized protein n=1 Tax=Aplosporella prunicola CBS 121167 TaxID=1176127 RepID=A0A6A6ATY7_9PEZI|nr:uncharacterized protein K452DRAFT_293234 [Aplosporella prunicola CBS 121167]KAF2135419.1 hypothetical protein K452DRAFT_293234 [Aplosporella prunicola CBS 121167]
MAPNPHRTPRIPDSFVRGYHSEAAFAFSPSDAEAIVRATPYHRKDFDKAVI